MSNKEKRILLATKIMQRLGILRDYIEAFKLKQFVTASEEPHGFSYYITEENYPKQKKVIEEMEKDNFTVFAVICGTYSIIGEKTHMDTYLFVTDEDVEAYGDISEGVTNEKALDRIIEKTGRRPGEFRICARAIGLGSDYGDVFVTGKNGGLTRTY